MYKDQFSIKGLGGKKTLRGKVEINGAKNAVLKAMAASVLFADEVRIENVPETEDVKKLSHLMRMAGAEIEHSSEKKELRFQTDSMDGSNGATELDHETTKAMRGSVMLTGPILARFGKVSFSAPGGCVIGARPIDLYIEAYKKMGAKVNLEGDRYHITAPGGLRGAEIFFNLQTVGGTETLMMAAVLAKGVTTLKNCAMEPEITSLAEYLVACGAEIKGIGTTTLEITGGKLLQARGQAYQTIPDRIEAGSFLLLGAMCAADLKITKCQPAHLEVLTNLLIGAGVPIEVGRDFLHIKGNGGVSNSKFTSFNVRTHEYPGFPTDLQAQAVTFLTQTTGETVVFETIYEGRFKYVQDLVRMGAQITEMNPREVLVRGGGSLKALGQEEELEARDIRAGFAIVMAALSAEGQSVVNNVYYIDRGYEKLEERLAGLGADIQRVRK